MASYPTDPETIVSQSYDYIRERISLPESWGQARRAVAERVAHTLGDLQVVERLRFSGEPVQRAMELIESRRPLVTDVSMVEAGIRSNLIADTGIETHTYVHEDAARVRAREREITRSAAGLELAGEKHDCFWLAVGNAPTVLLHMLEHPEDWKGTIPLVIGAPVGFVSVEESKERLLERSIPSIVLTGTRGGSPVAATIVNALLEWSRDHGHD